MAAMGQKKTLAVDSNLLFDLAAKKDFALTFLEVAREKAFTLHLPPTVIQELTFAAGHKHGEEKELALVALTNIRAWKIVPFDLIAVGHGITEQFARHLHQLNLLPEEEMNDGLIVAETGLAGIPALVTSDKHLLAIEEADLCAACRDKDIPEVRVAHPKKLLKAWGA